MGREGGRGYSRGRITLYQLRFSALLVNTSQVIGSAWIDSVGMILDLGHLFLYIGKRNMPFGNQLPASAKDSISEE